MRELLIRKIGPLPVWMWFLLFVLIGVVYFRHQKSKSNASTIATDNPNLVDTSGQSVLQFVAPDVFVNVQQPTTNPVTTPGVAQPAQYRTPRGPLPVGIPLPRPPRRVQSVTYPQNGATDSSTRNAVAAQYGYNGTTTTRTAQRLVRNQ